MSDPNPIDQTEEMDGKVEALVQLARTLVSDWPKFSPMLDPEVAKHGIRAFKAELRSRAFAHFCVDYAERPICVGKLRLDYLIGNTVVMVAMDLREENSHFERNLLQVLIAEGDLHSISHLLFLAKPGARARCNTPVRRPLAEWIEREYGVCVDVRELGPGAEVILNSYDS